MDGWMDGWMGWMDGMGWDGMGILMKERKKERNGRSGDRDGDGDKRGRDMQISVSR